MEKNENIRLTNFLRTKAGEAEQAIRYRPTYFLGMLETDGGYFTVIKLLSANRLSEGFKSCGSMVDSTYRSKHLSWKANGALPSILCYWHVPRKGSTKSAIALPVSRPHSLRQALVRDDE